MRRARELRQRWVEGLTGGPAAPDGPRQRHLDYDARRGVDYEDAPTQWVCNRKKAYPSEDLATRVSKKLNEENATGRGRDGFRGVVVVPYSCTRCGFWHLGR
jgi:hypothetical protein